MENTIFIPNVGYTAKKILDDLIAYCHGRPCVIWGAGNTGLRYKRILAFCGIELKYMVDGNPDKHKLMLSGDIPIYPPSHIKESLNEDTVFLLAVQTKETKDIVMKQLIALGISYCQIYMEELSTTLGNFPGFDIFLGTSKLDEEKIFSTYQNITANRPFKIAILGSSTTTDKNHGYLCWPRQLFNIMKERNISCIIYNGGTEAYISSQSFLKLVRDVLTLSPDAIIEYSGINDACEDFLDLEHPLVCRQLSKRTEKMLGFYNENKKPYIQKALYKGLSVSGFSRADIWYRNQRMMHAITREFNIPFFSFLEPTIYSGAYQLSASEQAAIEDDMLIGMKYSKKAEEFYSASKLYAASTPYIHDLTKIFDGLSGIMIDDRHCNSKGTLIIAETIFSILKENI